MGLIGRCAVAAIGGLVASSLAAGGTALRAASAQDIRVERDMPYREVGGETLLLDAYLPRGEGPFPAVITIHGGGLEDGSKERMAMVSTLLAQRGFVALAISYRLAPEFQYPAPLEDALEAVRFLRRNAARFNADPERIGAFGTSAGATLAVWVGAEGRGDAAVDAVVSWSGILDFASILQLRPGVALEPLRSFLGFDPVEQPERLDALSPINRVGEDNPATLLVNAARELVPLRDAEAMDERLQELGVPHDLLVPPRGHALAYTNLAIGPSVEFLNRHLRTPSMSTSAPPSPQDSRSGTGPWPALIGALLGLAVAATIVWLIRRRR